MCSRYAIDARTSCYLEKSEPRRSPTISDPGIGRETILLAISIYRWVATSRVLTLMPQKSSSERDVRELHLEMSDLETGLAHVGGYAFDESRPDERFFNWEWRDLYIGRLATEAITRIAFADGEVAGIVLIPITQASGIIANSLSELQAV